MSEFPRRRFLDRLGANASWLSDGSRFEGEIETAGALMLSGHARADGRIGGELAIGPQAHWEGNVQARSAVVAGRITGSITVAEKIEIAASAVIRGRVVARQIAMARGASIDGEVIVTGSEPILEFDEKRSTVPPAQAP
jgi:cytoskeletal protein CcmA (bactofilin family)